jgi:hypothetical protein
MLEKIAHTSVPALGSLLSSLGPEIVDAIEDKCRYFVSEMLQAGANQARRRRPSSRDRSPDSDAPRESATSPRTSSKGASARRREELYPGYGYKLPVVRSATALWDAWYGVGLFRNKPIEGGIAALEDKYKREWRRDYDENQRRMFSRYKKSVEMMVKEKDKRTDLEAFLGEMDALYKRNKALAITPFYSLMSERKKRNST